MSRLERQRWELAQDRWSSLQSYFSEEKAPALLGDAKTLVRYLADTVPDIPIEFRKALANECWDLLAYFKERHDEGAFLRDGFGVQGRSPRDDRGRGHTALARMKLLYDALAASIRSQLPSWKPVEKPE
jgi:hypothetical protein